jgi:hypothetical protein
MRTELPHSIQFHSGNFNQPGRRNHNEMDFSITCCSNTTHFDFGFCLNRSLRSKQSSRFEMFFAKSYSSPENNSAIVPIGKKRRLSTFGSSMNPYFLQNLTAGPSSASTTTAAEAICSFDCRARCSADVYSHLPAALPHPQRIVRGYRSLQWSCNRE